MFGFSKAKLTVEIDPITWMAEDHLRVVVNGTPWEGENREGNAGLGKLFPTANAALCDYVNSLKDNQFISVRDIAFITMK